MKNHTLVVELELPEADYLFSVPETNPLKEGSVFEPGMETIYDFARKGKVRDAILLKLFLPGEKITPELEPRIRSAIRRYCQFQIEKITDNLEIETRLGRRTLYYGISILVICLLLSGLGFLISSNATNPYLYALGGFMYNGFMIIGWVSLWTPTSMLVFERWPDWISRNTYEHLRDMQIEILPVSGTGSNDRSGKQTDDQTR
jgi:hypothetical protein